MNIIIKKKRILINKYCYDELFFCKIKCNFIINKKIK